MSVERLPVEVRIRRNIVVDDAGCWIWIGHVGPNGYGRMQVPRAEGGWKTGSAHRTSYQTFVGPIPAGMELDHLCKVKRCVNPQHLEPVDRRLNNERSDSPSAINARKSECVNGHPFSEANTYVNEGGRHCRACRREATRRWSQRRRAASA